MSRNRKNYVRSALLLVCLVSSPELASLAPAQEKAATDVRPPVDYSPIIAKLKEQLPQQMAQMNVPGLSIALVDGDTLVWAEGFGTTERNGQKKVTADTLFAACSISKTYTATGFLIAVEKGLIKLDDPVKKYLPQFTVKSRFGADEVNRITFRHLLSHRSGLTSEPPCGNAMDGRDCPFADHIRSISETWLKFPPGERSNYSNLGIDLAGYALEQRTGKPFDEYMNDELLRPLGMMSSTFNHTVAAKHPSLAKGHTRANILPVTPIPMIPAGSMYSTVKDMAKFISFHLACGKVGGKQIIREELLREMYAPQFPIDGQNGGYGLGIVSEPLRRGTVLYHGGGGYGYLTHQMWTPEYQVGVVVLTNLWSGGLPSQTAWNVLQQMIDAKYGPVPRRGPAPFTNKPVITLETRLLQRLEGTYKPLGNVVAFKVKKDGLYRVFETADVKLKAHSPTEFSSGDAKYTFFLDEAGKPKGVQVLSSSGVQFMPYNDRPGEEAGPNKKEWQDFVGEYAGKLFGDTTKVSVMIKNGYLYLEGWGGLKLTEYKPGLFFTADGEAVIFQNDRMSLANWRYLKESSTPSLFTPQSATVQPADKYADKLRIFEEFVRTQMEKDQIPGLTIGFYKDDYTWVKGFGYSDLENKIPAKAESAYRLASITKTFTSAAILQLAEKGKINLDAEIQTYVPYYPKQKWPVTVRQLLAHLGGGQEGSMLGPEYVSPREVVGRISKHPLKFEPGTKYEYTTSGYNLLGAAIEEVSGKSFGDYLRENIFLPLGMIGTRMNSETDLIPNRVRTYERVNGQIKVASFVDVSSRFGGGGLIGTIPDLLKWARSVDSGKILSTDSLDLMYSPVAMKNGYFAALDPPYRGKSIYSLGWHNLALNGQWVLAHGGGQIGTTTEFYRFPSKNMAIAFAANTHGVYGPLFIQRLYELLTDEPWEIPVYAKDRAGQVFYDGLDSAFDYGAAWFDRRRKPFTDDPQEMAKAFKYFNQALNLGSLQSNDQAALKAITDGLHPVADAAFLKVGSFIAAKLREKRGAEREMVYHTMGALPFFADYINLYQSQPNFPKELRFNEAFEKLIAKWNEDWNRTWNDYTQHLTITTTSDIDALGQKLKQLFAGAEVYPNFVWALRNASFQPGNGMKAAKLNLDLYPQHWRSNASWGVYLLLLQRSPGALEGYRRVFGELGQPLDYFKKSFELNPDGLTSAYLNEIAKGYTDSKRVDDAIALLKVAVELHPKSPVLYDSLGNLYAQKGEKESAILAYQKALEADPAFEHAGEMLKKFKP
jgi:CubicO group peptidase (beta-lactamase class C family)